MRRTTLKSFYSLAIIKVLLIMAAGRTEKKENIVSLN